MPRRAVAFALLAFSAAALGTWAGTALSAVPPVPTVSVPTVTVPVPPTPPVPAPVPLPPPPPAVTVPPKAEPPALPPPPPTPAGPPVPAPPVSAPTPSLPDLRGGDASSVTYSRKVAAGRPSARLRADGPTRRRSNPTERATASARTAANETRRAAAAATGRAPRAGEVAAAVQGTPEEDAGLLAPVASTLEKLSEPGLPGALFAMAALAAALLGVAAMPAPVSTSRAGATLVHKRGAIALAGSAAFVMAVTTYLLL